MEHYKEKLKIQNCFLGICCGILAVFAIFAAGGELGLFPGFSPATGNSHWASGWHGYIFGASIGIFSAMLGFLIRNVRAMKNDRKLKELYVKEHDERTIRIQTLAGNMTMKCLLWMGLVASIIAGYFSITVSITILACIFVSSTVNLILIAYYCKQM